MQLLPARAGSVRVGRSGSAAAKEVKSWVPRMWVGGLLEEARSRGMAGPDEGREHGGADGGMLGESGGSAWRERCGTRRSCEGAVAGVEVLVRVRAERTRMLGGRARLRAR